MARIDCPFCGMLGTLHAERVIQARAALTTYFCDACHTEWDERDDGSANPAFPPRKREPKTRSDKLSEA